MAQVDKHAHINHFQYLFSF